MNKKNTCICLVLAIAVAILFLSACHDEQEKWTHKTFQGTVIDIQEENDQRFFSLHCPIGENEYNEYVFVINQEIIYSIPFEIGDEVVVESDYNMNEHNGTSVPYPAVLIADPDITDKP